MRKDLLNSIQIHKYFLYAIGEIVLIVIGILLALWLNNWNNQRLLEIQTKNYALSLKEDLDKDIEMVSRISHQVNRIISNIDRIATYTAKNEPENLNNARMAILSWFVHYMPYEWNRTTLDQLKSTGVLTTMENNLSKMITSYDAFTHHMEKDFENDMLDAKYAKRLISQVVNYNYPNYYYIDTALMQLIETNKDLLNTSVYEMANDSNLALLREENELIMQSVNSLLIVRNNLTIRADIELPQLVNEAQNIKIAIDNFVQGG